MHLSLTMYIHAHIKKHILGQIKKKVCECILIGANTTIAGMNYSILLMLHLKFVCQQVQAGSRFDVARIRKLVEDYVVGYIRQRDVLTS